MPKTNTVAYFPPPLKKKKVLSPCLSWKNANGKVVVTTADGRSFEADYVIVTTSLGKSFRSILYMKLEVWYRKLVLYMST